MDGTYPIGARLPVEADLAAELSVGRSTVREAVKMLVSKGLLAVAPRRGTVVREAIDWHQLDPHLLNWRFADGEERDTLMRHLNEIRSVFEPLAAQLAAQRRTDADMTAIYRALADMRDANPETEAAVDADVRFHEAVATAANNPLLRQLALSLESALRHTFDVATLGIKDAYRTNLGVHQDIADAIARQDSVKAAGASRTLIARADRDRARQVPTGGH